MAEIRLFTSSSKREGNINVTAHLEPEGDGTHEKVIAQAKVDGFILPPGTYAVFSSASFDANQEARIRQIIHDIVDREIRRLDERIDDIEDWDRT